MNPNERTIQALRALADRLGTVSLPVGAPINHALSVTAGESDADRLLVLLLSGAIDRCSDLDRKRGFG